MPNTLNKNYIPAIQFDFNNCAALTRRFISLIQYIPNTFSFLVYFCEVDGDFRTEVLA